MNTMLKIREGELVHLIDRKGKRYQIVLKAGSSFSFTRGTVSHDDIIGLEEGSMIRSSLGEKLLVVRPTLAEFISKMRKGSQIIYPKDIAAILMLADIFPGAKVLEAGTGSGALTMGLLRAVGMAGEVVSYERREEFLEIARKNIETFFDKVESGDREGSGKLVLKEKDIYEGIEEKELDRIILDLSEPWRVLKHVEESLRNGGILLCYNPTVLQIYKLSRRLELKYERSFRVMGIYEVGLREWEIKGRSMRPELRMIAHTGFIFVARKCSACEQENKLLTQINAD
ncbi:MAG: tRNA (adenine-N1)-methyltransferase [Methanophagales archaeon]|nr:tRNA (adenine-N1)-methyltransferase [Methanophagales archaeon]